MKDLKKVEVGKGLAKYNHRKREELAKAQKSKSKLTSALGVLGYCIYQSKKGDVTSVHQSKEGDVTPVQQSKEEDVTPVQTHKFEME